MHRSWHPEDLGNYQAILDGIMKLRRLSVKTKAQVVAVGDEAIQVFVDPTEQGSVGLEWTGYT